MSDPRLTLSVETGRPRRMAGGHLPSLVTFLLTAGVILAADLVSKSLTFRHVADQPIELEVLDRGRRHLDPGDGRLIIPSDQPDLIPQRPEGRVVIPRVLNLILTTNTGALFGMGKGAQWLFTTISVLATGLIIHVFWRSQPAAYGLHGLLGAILAGALGNLYDRLRFSAVRDFLYLFPGVELPFGWHWPHGSQRIYPWIFNVADMALVVGVICLILMVWRSQQQATVDQRRQAATNR